MLGIKRNNEMKRVATFQTVTTTVEDISSACPVLRCARI